MINCEILHMKDVSKSATQLDYSRKVRFSVFLMSWFVYNIKTLKINIS